MKISVIGCSTTWSDRPTSSYCINENILVDAGEGTFKFYKNAGINFENIEYILITHLHSDHTFAVINHIYNKIWYYNKNQIKHLFIYGPKGIKSYIKKLIKVILPEYAKLDMSSFLHINEIDDFKKDLKIDNIKVKFFKLRHGDLENIAYVFDDELSKVGFSGDCTYTQNLDDFVNCSDILFLECCTEKTTEKHLGYDRYYEYVKKYPNKNFYAIHCNDYIYNNAYRLKIKLAKSGKIYNTNTY